MKHKQYLYISNPESFNEGSYNSAFTLAADPDLATGQYTRGWINAGEIEFEVNIDSETVTNTLVSAFDAEISKIRAESTVKIDMLQTKINELLAIEHKS